MIGTLAMLAVLTAGLIDDKVPALSAKRRACAIGACGQC